MFRQILVPLDGSPMTTSGLPLVQTLARTTHAAVVLLHVMPFSEGVPAPDRQAIEDAERLIGRIAAELRRGGLQVATYVRRGVVADQILAAARDGHVDLVVMATHSRAGLQRAVLGSVTERVLSESPAPVLLVRPGGHRATRIETLLVPVDGAPGAAIALSAATGLARTSGARMVLLDVAMPVPLWVFASEQGAALVAELDPSWDHEARNAAAGYVEGLARCLRLAGIAAEGRSEIGDPTQVIAAVAEQVGADMVVMSTHALSGSARTMLGSVADGVARTCGHPVLLVRRDRPADQSGNDPSRGTSMPYLWAGSEPARPRT